MNSYTSNLVGLHNHQTSETAKVFLKETGAKISLYTVSSRLRTLKVQTEFGNCTQGLRSYFQDRQMKHLKQKRAELPNCCYEE